VIGGGQERRINHAPLQYVLKCVLFHKCVYIDTRAKITIYDNTYNYYIYVYHYTLNFTVDINV